MGVALTGLGYVGLQGPRAYATGLRFFRPFGPEFSSMIDLFALLLRQLLYSERHEATTSIHLPIAYATPVRYRGRYETRNVCHMLWFAARQSKQLAVLKEENRVS